MVSFFYLVELVMLSWLKKYIYVLIFLFVSVSFVDAYTFEVKNWSPFGILNLRTLNLKPDTIHTGIVLDWNNYVIKIDPNHESSGWWQIWVYEICDESGNICETVENLIAWSWTWWSGWSQWPQWIQWATWASVVSGYFQWNDLIFELSNWNHITLVNAKLVLKWPKGDTWATWPQWNDWNGISWINIETTWITHTITIIQTNWTIQSFNVYDWVWWGDGQWIPWPVWPTGPQWPKWNTGAAWKWIKSITQYYAATSTQTQPSTITYTTIPTLNSTTNKYLWQKQVITFTDNTTQNIITLIAVYWDTWVWGWWAWYWKLNGATLSTSWWNYWVNLNSNLTVTGTTKIRWALDFAWRDDSNGYNSNKITTNVWWLNVSTQVTLNWLVNNWSSTLSGSTMIKWATTISNNLSVNGRVAITGTQNSRLDLSRAIITFDESTVNVWNHGTTTVKLNAAIMSGNLNLKWNMNATWNLNVKGNVTVSWSENIILLKWDDVALRYGNWTYVQVNDEGVTASDLTTSNDMKVNKVDWKIKVDRVCDRNWTNCKTVSSLWGWWAWYWRKSSNTLYTSWFDGSIAVNNITASGTTTLNGQLNVYQRARFYNGLSVQTWNLTVAGKATLQSWLTVTKWATINNILAVNGGNITMQTTWVITMSGNWTITMNNINLVWTRNNDPYLSVKNIRKNLSYQSTASWDRVISSIRLVPEDRWNGAKTAHNIYKDGLDTYREIDRYMPCSFGNEWSIVYYREYNWEYRAHWKFRWCICSWNYSSMSAATPNKYKCGWVDLNNDNFTEIANESNWWSSWN